MRKVIIFLSVLILTNSQMLLADTGSGDSAAGSLTSMPPSAPALNSPADGAENVLSSDVTWNTMTHAASYNLQVSTVSDFASTITDETGLTETTYTVPDLSGNVQYYWHVSGTNVAGTGDYSVTWDFTTDSALPVTLSTFYAIYNDGTTVVYWATECEENNQGWNIYRGEDADALMNNETITINSTLIPGAGTTQQITDYQFEDVYPVDAGSTYWYWLEDVGYSGETEIHSPVNLTISSDDPPPIPKFYGLYQNYPNPFNPSTSISFALQEDSDVELIIYNVKGEKIKSVFNDHIYADQINTAIWDGNDAAGKQVSSGIYFYKMRSDGRYTSTKKMILMK